VFTDEKKFRWDGPDGWKHYWTMEGEGLEKSMFSKDYGRYKGVMVWMAASVAGIIHIERIKGTLDAEKYADMVTGEALPSIHAQHGDNFILQQDNAAPHRATLTKETFEVHKIQVFEWPAVSRDLNIVEILNSLDDGNLRV
jgi:hypothetical protein